MLFPDIRFGLLGSCFPWVVFLLDKRIRIMGVALTENRPGRDSVSLDGAGWRSAGRKISANRQWIAPGVFTGHLDHRPHAWTGASCVSQEGTSMAQGGCQLPGWRPAWPREA